MILRTMFSDPHRSGLKDLVTICDFSGNSRISEIYMFTFFLESESI